MPSGMRTIKASPAEISDKLRMLLAAANCEILQATDAGMQFRHGTYLTQTAAMFPKHATIRLEPSPNGTLVTYEIQVAKPLVA